MSHHYHRIAIIDSGIDKSIAKSDNNIQGIEIIKNPSGKHTVSNNFHDDIGHGTGIYEIIRRHNTNAEFFVVKVCNSKNNEWIGYTK